MDFLYRIERACAFERVEGGNSWSVWVGIGVVRAVGMLKLGFWFWFWFFLFFWVGGCVWEQGSKEELWVRVRGEYVFVFP